MNVSYVTPSLDTYGGAERLIAKEIQFLTDRGHNVTVIVDTLYDESVLEDYGIKDVAQFQTFTGNNLVERLVSLRTVIKSSSPEIVFVHYLEKRCYLALLTIPNSPSIISHVHGSVLWFKDDPDRFPHMRKRCYEKLIDQVAGHREFYEIKNPGIRTRLRSEFYEFLMKRALKSCQRVFTGSNVVARELRALYDIDPDVAHPGVDKKWIAQYEEIPMIDLTDKKHAVLYVGRLDKRKRVNLLIRSFERLIKKRDDVELLIGGTGDEQQELNQLVSELGLENNVRFIGHIPEESLASHYKSADVFVTPGWMSYGIVPLEAYAMRTKVAISTDAFANEVIGGLSGARVVEPNMTSWVESMDELLDLQVDEFDVASIPTWFDFCRTKFDKIDEVLH